MVTFTQIPDDYSPVGECIVYGFECDTAQTVDIRVTEAETGDIIGVRRFVKATAASCDIAPMLRRAIRIEPATGATGVYPADGRQLRISVQAFPEQTETAQATAPTRTVIGCRTRTAGPALLTTMPRNRLIAPGECDELLFRLETAGRVTVTAQSHDTLSAQSFSVPEAGLWIFRLDTQEFPEAESITADLGACGTVTYTLVGSPHGAKRIAWRSSEASVEHYTFPTTRSVTVEAGKTRAYGPDGHTVAQAQLEERQLLVSAFETTAVLEALAELLATPGAWIAGREQYAPVDILTEQAVIRRYGVMSSMELEIRPKQKNSLPWN